MHRAGAARRLYRIFVGRAFRLLRLVVVMPGRRWDQGIVVRVARRISERIRVRCGVHQIVHERVRRKRVACRGYGEHCLRSYMPSGGRLRGVFGARVLPAHRRPRLRRCAGAGAGRKGARQAFGERIDLNPHAGRQMMRAAPREVNVARIARACGRRACADACRRTCLSFRCATAGTCPFGARSLRQDRRESQLRRNQNSCRRRASKKANPGNGIAGV